VTHIPHRVPQDPAERLMVEIPTGFDALLTTQPGLALEWRLATREIFESLNLDDLPRHEVVYAEIPGRSGTLMLQGGEFLANL